jgi:hypothetical protein
MIYTKCPICKKGNPFEVCCGQDKASGKKIYTIFSGKWNTSIGLAKILSGMINN